jgi:Glycoside hydrolase family 44
MKKFRMVAPVPTLTHLGAFLALSLSAALLSSCGGGSSPTLTPVPTTYILTVNSTNPASGVAITVGNPNNNVVATGTTSFSGAHAVGATVLLSAPSTAGGNTFSSWTGCTSVSTVNCTVTMNANTTVTANYVAPTGPKITSVTVTPNPATATVGGTVQFAATVAGTGNYSNAVTWSLLAPSSSALSPGTLTSAGLYTTPYPAPATVTVTATSVADTTQSGSVTVTLAPPATAAGPALTVDAGSQTHAISPYIYGMNAYTLDASAAKAANLPIDRWGGDSTSRYNYKLDVTSSASDYYFENQTGTGGDGANPVNGVTAFDAFVQSNVTIGAKTLGTVPVMGWVAKDSTSCSFPTSTYPNQYAVDPYRACGDGELANQTDITGNSPTATSTAVGPAWAGSWVAYLAGKFGTAANGGVAVYDLDNEPSWWDAVHRDVHPVASTYDEVTNNGIATAQAIKTADATAEVSGPVVDYWWNYFYSKKDIESGWGSGSPCYSPWSNPVDREAHSGIPFIEYYLQQFKASEISYGSRLLDYLDLHTYFAPDYQGNSLAFATAGDTGEQQVRLNSTRVFWDPTYTDPNYPQPNYSTDANYSTSCSPPLQAPQLIPMMQGWVAKDYPGTKTAITEYNWGGQESINGALTQADILGIFGSYGLDLGTLWGPPDPTTQIPGLMAFEIYRNYDGSNSTFGNQALTSTSADQGALSVYAALRTSDNTVTVVVINKTYGDLTDTLSLANLTPNGPAKVFLYSTANLAGIVAQPDLTVTAPSAGSATSTLSATFPAQSITLVLVPKM